MWSIQNSKNLSDALGWMGCSTLSRHYYFYRGSYDDGSAAAGSGDFPECALWIVFPSAIRVRPDQVWHSLVSCSAARSAQRMPLDLRVITYLTRLKGRQLSQNEGPPGTRDQVQQPEGPPAQRQKALQSGAFE